MIDLNNISSAKEEGSEKITCPENLLRTLSIRSLHFSGKSLGVFEGIPLDNLPSGNAGMIDSPPKIKVFTLFDWAKLA